MVLYSSDCITIPSLHPFLLYFIDLFDTDDAHSELALIFPLFLINSGDSSVFSLFKEGGLLIVSKFFCIHYSFLLLFFKFGDFNLLKYLFFDFDYDLIDFRFVMVCLEFRGILSWWFFMFLIFIKAVDLKKKTILRLLLFYRKIKKKYLYE